MTNSQKLHSRAMDFYENYLLEKSPKNDQSFYKAYFLNLAFEFEKKAVSAAFAENASVLDLSVLHRSAATIALQAGEFTAALELAENGMALNPPAEILAELKEVRENILKAQNTENND